MAKLWFRARRYGWGWTPCSIEGWLVMIAAALTLIGGDLAILYLANKPGISRTVALLLGLPYPFEIIVLTLVWNALIIGITILVSWKFGERPSWH
jgi:hypothetical protein